MKKLIILCFSLLMVNVLLLADEGSAGQGGEFLRYGVDAKAFGMGRAHTAFSGDANSIYWNPAGMFEKVGYSATTMYSRLYGETNYGYLGFLYTPSIMDSTGEEMVPDEYWRFGGAAVYLGTSEFDKRSEFNEPEGTGGHMKLGFIGSAAYRFQDEVPYIGKFFVDNPINFGMSGKFYTNHIDDVVKTHVLMDMGMRFKMEDYSWAELGMAIQNLNFWDDEIPTSTKLGFHFSPEDVSDLPSWMEYVKHSHLTLDYDIVPPGERDAAFYVGYQYQYQNLPFVVLLGYNQVDGFTAGFNFDISSVLDFSTQYDLSYSTVTGGADNSELGGFAERGIKTSLNYYESILNIEDLYNRGLQGFLSQDYYYAGKKFDKVIKNRAMDKKGFTERSLIRKGDIALMSNEFGEALGFYKQNWMLYVSEYPDPYINSSAQYYVESALNEKEFDTGRTIAENPEYGNYALLGIINFIDGQYGEAENNYSSAVGGQYSAYEDFIAFHKLVVLIKQEKWDEAKALIDEFEQIRGVNIEKYRFPRLNDNEIEDDYLLAVALVNYKTGDENAGYKNVLDIFRFNNDLGVAQDYKDSLAGFLRDKNVANLEEIFNTYINNFYGLD